MQTSSKSSDHSSVPESHVPESHVTCQTHSFIAVPIWQQWASKG